MRLLSGVTIWTFYDVIVWIGYANGWAPMITMQSNPIWFFTLFLFLPLIQSFHFYWIHRGLHIPFFYKRVHSVHHRSVSVAPWSGFSMHPIEHFFYMSSAVDLPGCASASHPFYFHGIFAGHSLQLRRTLALRIWCLGIRAHLKIGSFHHQLHHRYFECNYGGPEMPWDNWFGSFHDGSPEATQRVRETKKRMHTK